MEIRSKLADLAVECLKPGHFLVDVIASSRNLSKITIVVDGDQGVTIDDCGEISRQLSAKLDAMDFGTGRYVLEVTTPGLDQPLKLKRQYTKNVGRTLKVHRKDKSLVSGRLANVDDQGIVLAVEKKEGKNHRVEEVQVSFNDIEKAFVTISF
ncbi:MAG: ribosome maturation factor RimP [Cyclobacteriaceae bacterium]|nr:ribosome maturation factor RimP [Cyclobacteriaceae bacterium]